MSGSRNQPKGPPKGGGGNRGSGPPLRGGGRAEARAERARAAEAAAGAEAPAASPEEMPRLQKRYRDEVRAKLQQEFGYTNPMQVPKLEKIVINMGVGDATADQKKLDAAVDELTAIAGQKPVKTLAKKAIAGFKIRKGLAIGCKVTLRKARMYEFLDRLITIAMPRVRDFRGIAGKGFDGRGNFAMGVKEQIIFPEINYDRVEIGAWDGHPVRHHRQDGRGSEGFAEGLRSAVRQLRNSGMAKTSQVNRNRMREYMAKRDKSKRSALKAIVMDRTLPVEDRFNASLKLAQLPRNGAEVRVRLRCELTGRSRGNYRKFKLCRIKLRELSNQGQIPGMVKASW